MNTSKTNPTITRKFPIEVPTHTYGSPPSVFKIMFGTKYLIWKGKSLLQACEFIAENLERYIRLGKDIPTDQIHHVAAHVKKTRCVKAKCIVLGSDFQEEEFGPIDGYRMLKYEQDLLDGATGDPLCLNNNEQAYVPGWMTKQDQEKFLIEYEKKHGK